MITQIFCPFCDYSIDIDQMMYGAYQNCLNCEIEFHSNNPNLWKEHCYNIICKELKIKYSIIHIKYNKTLSKIELNFSNFFTQKPIVFTIQQPNINKIKNLIKNYYLL